MVSLAVWLLTVAVAAGIGLGMWHLRATDAGSRPPTVAGIAHGFVGSVGLVVLLLALRGPARGVAQGVGSFGATSAWLIAAALVAGVLVYLRRRRAPAVMMAVHSGIAITGYVLLLAWNSLG